MILTLRVPGAAPAGGPVRAGARMNLRSSGGPDRVPAAPGPVGGGAGSSPRPTRGRPARDLLLDFPGFAPAKFRLGPAFTGFCRVLQIAPANRPSRPTPPKTIKHVKTRKNTINRPRPPRGRRDCPQFILPQFPPPDYGQTGQIGRPPRGSVPPQPHPRTSTN